MTAPTNLVEAAALLGVPTEEVVDVADSPAGTLITTFDGVRYVHVAEDNPDADGRHGLLLLTAPTAHYGGPMPVYAQAGATEASGDPDDDPLARLRADLEARLTGAPSGITLEDFRRLEERLSRLEGERSVDAADDHATGVPPAGSAVASATTAGEQAPGAGSDEPTGQVVVPTGHDATPEKVLAWVGDDPARARQALDAENSRPSPRKSLLRRLEALDDEG